MEVRLFWADNEHCPPIPFRSVLSPSTALLASVSPSLYGYSSCAGLFSAKFSVKNNNKVGAFFNVPPSDTGKNKVPV